jgi:hypothetical protein
MGYVRSTRRECAKVLCMASELPPMAERAAQLARRGDCEFIYQIGTQLRAEGYTNVEATFERDAQFRKTLCEIMDARRSWKPVTKRGKPRKK